MADRELAQHRAPSRYIAICRRVKGRVEARDRRSGRRLAARARNDVFGAEGRSCRAQGAMALQEAAKLLLAEPPEKRPEPLPSMEIDRLEHVVRGGGRLDQNDARSVSSWRRTTNPRF